jgi:hypothetical protein
MKIQENSNVTIGIPKNYENFREFKNLGFEI